MRPTQIERAKRPVPRRRRAVAVAIALGLGLSFAGPSTLWAEPADLTAADFVRMPERQVDLEPAQAPHDARTARSREAAQQRIVPQGGGAPKASTASSADALGRDVRRNQLRGVPLE